MIERKKKICKKGSGKSIGFPGCSSESWKLEYGLCTSCLYDWMTQTEPGKIEYQKRYNYLKAKNWKEEKAKMKESVKTLSDYKSDLQKEINTLARLLDFGHNCISSGLPLDSKYDAGHMWSRGSNPSLAFNLMNIYGQTVYANQWKSGDQLNYIEGLEKEFGREHKEYVLGLKNRYPILKITIEEIKTIIPRVRGLIKWVKLQDRKFTTEERISLRYKFNYKIGIYI